MGCATRGNIVIHSPHKFRNKMNKKCKGFYHLQGKHQADQHIHL